MSFYMKKPILVEAHQFRGSTMDLIAFENWFAGQEFEEPAVTTRDIQNLIVQTEEGPLRARPGDWVLKGPEGEFWPVKESIFALTYDQVVARG